MGFLSWVRETVTGTPEAIRQFDSPENCQQRTQEWLNSDYMKRDAAYQERGRQAALVVSEDKSTAVAPSRQQIKTAAGKAERQSRSSERAVEYFAAKIDPAKVAKDDLQWLAAMPTRTVERHVETNESAEWFNTDNWTER